MDEKRLDNDPIRVIQTCWTDLELIVGKDHSAIQMSSELVVQDFKNFIEPWAGVRRGYRQ